jgi:putative tricarboxylic transport membrane protein
VNSDRLQGGFWVLAGGAIFAASWTMDRLANLGVQPYSAPGLLPGVLGVFIVVLGIAMLLRSQPPADESGDGPPIAWRRVFVPMALCIAFAAGLVGHGVPFWLAGWIFIAVMIWTLQYAERKAKGELLRLAALAIAVGAGASIAVSLIFQELFLIRLP